MVPAVAVKFADVAPEATVADAGTVNAVTLLDSETVTPPELAARDNVTVHVDVPPEFRLVGEQETRLTAIGGTSRIDAVRELLLYDAVTVAV